MKFSSSVIVLLFLFFIVAAASASVVEETPPDDASSIGRKLVAASASVVEETPDDASVPGRRRRKLVAASSSVVDATPDDASVPGRRRRKLVAKSNGVHPETAAQTPAPTRYLAVQTGGPEWTITQQASAGIYTLRATVGQEMVLFSERPARIASTVSTQKFVDNFANIFDTSNPNAAITFTSTTASADNNNGPLIVELSRPRMEGSIIEYTMTQSSSQGEVASIDQFLEMSGSCSIFIDGFSDRCKNYNTCKTATGIYGGVSSYNKEEDCFADGVNSPYPGESDCSKDDSFETCYVYGEGEGSQNCWTRSIYAAGTKGWFMCYPTGVEKTWKPVDVVYGTNNCGQPCENPSVYRGQETNCQSTATPPPPDGSSVISSVIGLLV